MRDIQPPDPVVVDGRHLHRPDVVAIARGRPPVQLDPAGRARAHAASELAIRVAATRPIYGRSTGVGANRVETVTDDAAGHGLRLLRSHASGTGDLAPPERARAMMVVRLNQFAAGGSGVHPTVLDALVSALDTGAVPAVHQVGAIGTGDVCALADLALALCGDRRWRTDSSPAVTLSSPDALALISSNAATIGEAVLTRADLDALLRASEVVAALYGAPVQNARPHPGQLVVATRMRRLLGLGPTSRAGRRLQDPFSLRAVPQVHGTAVDAVERLGAVLDVEINGRAENPLLDVGTSDAWHNANFHTGYLAHALDSARAAVYPVAELSAARLGDLVDPDFTGLAAFLAEGPPGSSGVMALEYVAQDGVASLRHNTLPATLGSAVISRGLEDHASYSTHGARLATVCVSALRAVLAAELVAAVRAVEMGAAVPDGLPLSSSLRTAYTHATAVLDARRTDRSLSADLAAAEILLTQLGHA